MGSYRSRLDIIANILNVIHDRESAKKTQIMYGANLNCKLLGKYLNQVLRACLVRSESEERCYVLTAKGNDFLEKYREYSKRNRHVEKQLSNVQSKRKVLEKLCSNTQV